MLAGYRPPCRGVVCGRRDAPRSGMAWQDASDSGASVCPLVSIAAPARRSVIESSASGLCCHDTHAGSPHATHARVPVGSCALSHWALRPETHSRRQTFVRRLVAFFLLGLLALCLLCTLPKSSRFRWTLRCKTTGEEGFLYTKSSCEELSRRDPRPELRSTPAVECREHQRARPTPRG